MCYALLFAFADRWVIAKLLARKAIYISRTCLLETEGAEAGRVSGREANYLAAVTHRLTARSPVDLGEATAFLAEARTLWKAEPEPRTAGTGAPRMTGLRFASEEAAIETARLLFMARDCKWKLEGRNDILASAVEIAGRIGTLLADDCEHGLVRKSSFINLRVNLISCIFILECGNSVQPELLVDLHELAQAQIADIVDVYSAHSSSFNVSPIDFWAIVYAMSFSGRTAADDDRLLLWADELEDFASLPQESFLMPYDRGRCAEMQALAAHRLAARTEAAGSLARS
jgi:hypothetical protein